MRVWVGAMLGLLLAVPARADDAYDRAAELVSELYLHRESTEPAELLRQAARHAAFRIDWLTAREDDGGVALYGPDGALLGRAEAHTWDELPQALRALDAALHAAEHPLGNTPVPHLLIQGASQGLDRYSRVLAGARLERFDTRIKGTLVGVGATLGQRDGLLTVVDVLPGGPAERAGVRADDQIWQIDGQSTVNMPVSEAVRRVRGDKGTAVTLAVFRPTVDAGGGDLGPTPHWFRITRDEVVLPNVTHRVLEGDVAYVAIDHISQKTVYNLRRALAELAEGDHLGRGLVLDLRGNTGGSMKQSAGVVDQLVEEGLLVRTAGPDGGPVPHLMHQIDARDGGDEPPVPVVLLTNRRTASGAEIIAGSLVQHGRATVVGQRSYGKGKVQKIYALDEEARLKLTVAEYVLEGGVRVDDDGLGVDLPTGEIWLDEDGVRHGHGWDLEREGVAWDSILPLVRELPSWRGREGGSVDLEVELARRTVLGAEGPSRAQTLAAALEAAHGLRSESEALLVEALAARDIDWSAAPADAGVPQVEVVLDTHPDPDDPLRRKMRVHLRHRGATPLHRVVARLVSEDNGAWDGLVLTFGRLDPGAEAEVETSVRLRQGITPRRDRVHVEVRAHRRPTFTSRDHPIDLTTPPRPPLSLTVALEGEGPARRAHVAALHRGDRPVEGLEVAFGFPGDLPVTLVDQAVRHPVLAPGDTATLSLALQLDGTAPDPLPLELRASVDTYGRLADWPVALPLDGTPVHLEAPTLGLVEALPTAAPGPAQISLWVRDDHGLASVVAFLDHDKILYDPVGSPQLDVPLDLDLTPGRHVLTVRARDDQDLVTTETWSILVRDDGEGLVTPEPVED